MYLDVNPVAPTGMTFLTSFTAISYSRYVPSLSIHPFYYYYPHIMSFQIEK